MIKLILNMNSFEKAVAVGLGANLAGVLRENLFLTYTKAGCGKGERGTFHNYERKALSTLVS
jgi:aldehyde oxidoreductase